MYTTGEAIIMDEKGDKTQVLQDLLSYLNIRLYRTKEGEILENIKTNIFLQLIIFDYEDKERTLILCERVREVAKSYELPIIIIAEQLKPEDRIAALKAGADDIFEEPVHREELWYKVKKLIEVRRRNLEVKTVNEGFGKIISYSEEMFQ